MLTNLNGVILQKREQAEADEQFQQNQFRARGVPKVKSKFVLKKSQIPLTEPMSPQFATNRRRTRQAAPAH